MPVRLTTEPVVLTDTPQVVTARQARRFVRRAFYVAVLVTTSPGGATDMLDVSKARVLRMLARRDHVWVSEIFGTVIVGRPEPIPSPCSRCYPEDAVNDEPAIDLN